MEKAITDLFNFQQPSSRSGLQAVFSFHMDSSSVTAGPSDGPVNYLAVYAVGVVDDQVNLISIAAGPPDVPAKFVAVEVVGVVDGEDGADL